MLKFLHATAKLSSTQFASLSLTKTVMLVVLMLGLQHDQTTLIFTNNADYLITNTDYIVSVKRPLITASPAHRTASADRLTDRISRPVNPLLPLATSMSGSRVALTSFTTSRVAPASATLAVSDTTAIVGVTTIAKAARNASSNFQFNQILKQSLFKAVVSSPFAIGFGDDARLAIWQENPDLALVNKDHKFVIILDPGHGGTDPGSMGHNGLQEKTLTLDIAKRAKRLLSGNKNLSVILTRNNDIGMSRKNRVLKVKRSKADMFVSLHLNHLPQANVNLVETFYAAPHNILESIQKQRLETNADGMVATTATLNPNLAFTHGSKQLASLMQKRVFDEVIDNNPETDNAGVKEDTLFILTRSFTPGALIELSCLSNVEEAERLNNPAYRQKLAAALANGIRDYLSTPAAKRQFGPEV